MSIRVVDEVPTYKREGQRDKIKADIKEAINKRISSFEFTGDYNYKTLAESARATVSMYFCREIWGNKIYPIREKLKEEYKVGYISYVSSSDYVKRFMNIYSRTIDGRKHVYATIDFEFLDNIEKIVEKDIREKMERRKEKNL